MRRLLTLLGLCLLYVEGWAQSEGRGFELGASLGLIDYRGDVGVGFFDSFKPTIGLTTRYNRNLRLSYHASLDYSRLSGSTAQGKGGYPAEASFTTNSLGCSIGVEYHWYRYGVRLPYLQTKTWTPYITAGGGLQLAWDRTAVISPSLYIGAGVKYQLRPNCQLILSYAWHYFLSDRLDALSDDVLLGQPFGQSSHWLRHGDAKGVVSLGISWKLKYKHLNCN